MKLQLAPPPQLIDDVAGALAISGVRWRALEGGRVNTLWRVGQVVVKQYQLLAASPLFPNDPKAEAAALDLFAPLGLSPDLLAQGEGWIAYRHLPGKPWRKDTVAVATTLTRLHQVRPLAGFRAAPNGSASLLRHAKSIADLCECNLPSPPPDPAIKPAQSCMIHGDAVPGNIIVHQGNMTLIDWQCPAIGDPCEDIATFLSPAMQLLYRGAPLTCNEVAAFRAACPTAAIARYDSLAAIYHWRMAAHCLWKAERGAQGYALAAQLELQTLKALPQKNT